jgi:hypothetical protein
MFVDNEVEELAQRERIERYLAGQSTDEAARVAHIVLAENYRNRALSAGYRNETRRMFTRI